METPILNGAVPLESILCTEELHRRPSRSPDYEKENRALVALAGALTDSSHNILQTLAETILRVTESDSSGLSLLTTDDGGRRFYWPAIAGVWKPHIGGGTPRNFGPCGDVLNCNDTLLFKHFERRYPYLLPVMPPAEECLLLPFYVEDKAVGTIWAIMHSDRRVFDAEDERIMGVLGQFASLAYQTLASIDDLKLQVARRKKAEAELLALTDGLERQVQVRTKELEHRNRQLGEAKARLAEEKLSLERSEAYLAEAQRLSHTGSWHWNVATQEVFSSQELLAIFGFDSGKDKAPYSLYLERIHPDDRFRVEELRRVAIREKKDFEDEYRILLPGGSIRYVHTIAHCLVSQSGGIEYVGALREITEQKRAEGELVALKDELTAELTAMTRLHEFSTRLFAISEFKPLVEEVLDATMALQKADFGNIQLYNPETQALETVAQRGFHQDFLEYSRNVRDTGTACRRAMWLRERVIIEDVETDSQFAPHRHIAALAGFRGVQSTPLFGRSGDFLGMLSTHFRLPHRPPPGDLRFTDLYARNAADVIERRRLEAAQRQVEQALHTTQVELARVSRLTTMGELAASIAHEVNQPLAAVTNNASACLRLLDGDRLLPEVLHGALEEIVANGARASAVIARIRGFIKKAPAERNKVNINQAIQVVLDLVARELCENRISLQTQLAKALPPVLGDRVQLQQVLLNLIMNAIEAMASVKNRPRMLWVQSQAGESGSVLVAVRDSGTGFDQETFNHLCSPFFTTKANGLGMGLSISRSLIEGHGGRLWADPNSPYGAVFQFALPIATGNSS